MGKVRMGDLLVRAGLITESDLRVALAQQKQHGGKLGEHLVRVNLLTEETLARALAQQLGLVYNDLIDAIPPAVIALIPEKVAARLQALAVAYDARSSQLSVAFSDPLDDNALAEVAKITGKQIVAQVTPGLVLRRAIEHAYFGVDVRDEGTNEFQLVDIHGRGKTVRVPGREREEDLPELGTSELVPLDESEIGGAASEHAPVALDTESPRLRVAPSPSRAQPARPVPAKPAQDTGAGDEALRMVWAIADLLIDRGYFTRAELMKSLRNK